MNTAALLPDLKLDIGLRSDRFDTRLLSRLSTAEEEITAMGIQLRNTSADRDLVVMYAGWLWKSRITGEGKPRMLQLALNNRIFRPREG